MVSNIKKSEKTYKESINNLNIKKVKRIQKEKELLSLYEQYDKNYSQKIKEIIGKFVELIKNLNEKNQKLLEDLDKAYNDINVEKDINNCIDILLNANKDNKKVEEDIKYETYKPACTAASKIDSKNLNVNDLDINYRITVFLKKNFNDICPEINLEEENQKNMLRTISTKIFNSKDKISDEDQKKILSLLESKKNRDYLIILLSKQRTNSRFQKSKNIIRNMGEILKKILELAEKENEYEQAKNCIILSQTFYSEEKGTKIKNYLFEYIKNNKWLTSIEFWEKMVEYFINKEIENNNNILGKENLEKETPEIRKVRISQVCLTQLITFSGNMVDLNLDKENIKQILDFNIQKYGVDNNNATILYENLESTWKENEKKKLNQIAPENDDILYTKMKLSKLKTCNDLRRKNIINFEKVDINELNKNNKNNKNKKRRNSISGIRNEKYILTGINVFDAIKKVFIADLKVEEKSKSENVNKRQNLIKSVKLPSKLIEKEKSENLEKTDKKGKFK